MDEASFKLFDLEALVEKCRTRGSPYLEFLRVPQLSCGIYRLKVGATDTQSAHDEDEVYFVLTGRAMMRVGGVEKALDPGSILYVPADTEHEFVEIEEDLSLLVFFGSGGPSGGEV
ncbi:MAG: cupin domain-containing protein [Spirochaetaceae bacterium]|nr:cupin domain-containing protein [Myxococcales bacterium]MCB9723896.1 cupin domain-containing protein [Spirochaetaceae bacterium]HPG26518.1 cupin domain-containing protein [Myxococcota bacterium]